MVIPFKITCLGSG